MYQQLDRVLEALEGEPCQCAEHPCQHSLAAAHTMSLERWAALLAQCKPDEYTERPQDPNPSDVITEQGRVAVLMLRVERGYSLFHPDDLWNKRPHRRGEETDLKVGATMQHCRNGRDVHEQEITTDEEDELG